MNSVCESPAEPAPPTTKAALMPRVQAALRACRDVKKKAMENCSADRGSRAPEAARQNLREACEQLADTSRAASEFNNAAGGTCQGLQGACRADCTEEYNRLKPAAAPASCSDCDEQMRTAIEGLKTNGDGCETLTANINRLLDQTGGLARADTIASQCASLSGAVAPGTSAPGGPTPGGATADGTKPAGTPAGNTNSAANKNGTGSGSGMNPASLIGPLTQMAMAMMQQQPQQQQQTAAAQSVDSVDCSVNPNLAGCAAAATSDSWNAKTASAEMSNDSAAGGNFNPASENTMAPASTDSAGERKPSSPPTVGTVPNGGGGMPGGGGGGAASLGGGGGGGGGAGARTSTDVLHGMSAGGGGMSAMNAQMNMKNGEAGGGYTYGQGNPYGHDDAGLDLSQFLPGGKQDPTRKLAGMASGGGNFQIQSKEVNIWSRISERIKARCSQGLLRDCIP